jgi:Concanavalin A-like lectin/glucanases superfamily
MLELICQQRYRAAGVPVDISPYRNHGVANDAPGRLDPDLGYEVISFPNPDSGVSIGLGTMGAWAPLVALRVQVTARLDPGASLEQLLVEGDGAFMFYVNQGAIAASVGADYLRAADEDAPDGAYHPVPVNRWTQLVLDHDGFAWVRLYMDGVLVAAKRVTGGAPPVQGGGVSIGNGLRGEIAEVAVWRLDPHLMRREFLCRPYSAKTAACWTALFNALRGWIATHPAQAAALYNLIEGRIDALIRSLYLLPEAEQARARADLAEIAKLWCEGHLNSRRMADVLKRWRADLRRWDAPQLAIPTSELERELQGLNLERLTLECDPAALEFLGHLAAAVSAAGA